MCVVSSATFYGISSFLDSKALTTYLDSTMLGHQPLSYF